jgi:hypothetical protein
MFSEASLLFLNLNHLIIRQFYHLYFAIEQKGQVHRAKFSYWQELKLRTKLHIVSLLGLSPKSLSEHSIHLLQNAHFLNAYGLFSVLGYKRSLNKFKAMQITSSIFSGPNSIQLEINNRKNSGNFSNT